MLAQRFQFTDGLVGRTVGLGVCYAVAALSIAIPQSFAQEGRSMPEQAGRDDRSRTVLVEAGLVTWMRRGRTLMEIAPRVKSKLRDAGLKVVSSKSEPHALVLRVDYREDRGQQYRLDDYGTNITCHITLQRVEEGTLLDFTIRETSGDEFFGTPPYLEAMRRFETNPYFYLLGELVKGRAFADLDTEEALIHGLAQFARPDEPAFDSLSAPHTLMDVETGYAEEARDRTIEELGWLGDARAVPVLAQFLKHDDPLLRRRTATALGGIHTPESRAELERTATSDADERVREAALAALSTMASTPAR